MQTRPVLSILHGRPVGFRTGALQLQLRKAHTTSLSSMNANGHGEGKATAAGIKSGCGPSHPRRLGQVIELREECAAEYMRVHADDHPGVRDLLAKYGLHNMSIFLQVVKGTHLLFLYAEYTGQDFERDMAGLKAEPRDMEWHAQCDPMQLSLHAAGGWQDMQCVYYNP